MKLVLSLVPAIWVAAVAILSVQNATPVSLQFLTFRSIEMPMGVLLGICAAGGMVGTALLISLERPRQQRSRRW
ncbi:lipopolysaccharide assembly protein LapA domain-containing protein [Halomicronema hongdechloris]|nr:LapA family protein [Halomicronema hongdechloris]